MRFKAGRFAFLSVFTIIVAMSERETGIKVSIDVKKGGLVYIAGPGEPSQKVQDAVVAITAGTPTTDFAEDGRTIEPESDATIAIREFVREHGQEIVESLSGKVEDEFAQFKDASGPFEALVQAARKEGMTIGDVKRVVRDEVEHANVNSENKLWVSRVIADALIGFVTKVYLIPEHDVLYSHDES